MRPAKRALAGFPALVAALLLYAGPAPAEITPQAGSGDPHIQSVLYDPQQVVGLHVAAGYAVTVQFSPDERIETVTVGDPGAWHVQVNHAADDLVVKAQGIPAPTDLTVITDARTYNFTLYGASPGEGVQPYVVSFLYPPPVVEQAAVEPVPVGRYKLHGDKALWPRLISDDGAATSIRWPAEVSIPAVYRQDDESGMALVNGVMKDGAYVVDGVHRELIFIAGKAQAHATRIRPKHSSRSPAP